jgi:CHRD domain/PEP-CTERM motif
MKLCKKIAPAILFCLILTCFIATPAKADTIIYDVVLSGASESPANTSPGKGFAILTINTVAQTIEVNVTFSGLVAGDTATLIHCCTATPGAGNAGVASTTPSFPMFPLGVTSGSYDQVFDLTASSTYNPAFVAAQGSVATAETALLAGLADGEAYLNIHTTEFPGGEIRGFFPPVAAVTTPEPSSLWLFGIGLLALVGATKVKFPVS